MFVSAYFCILFTLVEHVLSLPYYQTFRGENGDIRLRNVTVFLRGQARGHQYVWKIGGRVQYYDTALQWGYICTGGPAGQTYNEGVAFIICHQLNMKYHAAITDGTYGDIEAGTIYSVATITCPDTEINRGPNSLVDCAKTQGSCSNPLNPPAGIECTLPFSESLACYNGGTPTSAESGNGDSSDSLQIYIYCECPPEFTGDMCEKKLTPTCHNGGTPEVQSDDTFLCACTDEFTGTYCESNLKPTCHNGGTPAFSSSAWSCNCTDQFQGDFCETDLKHICLNGGTAELSGSTWGCTCLYNFTGSYCETELQFTAVVAGENGTQVLLQCLNKGYIDLATKTCQCVDSFTGDFCETAPKQVTDDDPDNLSVKNKLFLWILILTLVILIVVGIMIYACVKLRREKARRVGPGHGSQPDENPNRPPPRRNDSTPPASAASGPKASKVQRSYMNAVSDKKAQSSRGGLPKKGYTTTDLKLEDVHW